MKERRMAKLIRSNALSICNIKIRKTKRLIIADDFLDKIKEQIRKMEEVISKRKKKIIRILEGGVVKKMTIKRENNNKRIAVFNIKPFPSILRIID